MIISGIHSLHHLDVSRDLILLVPRRETIFHHLPSNTSTQRYLAGCGEKRLRSHWNLDHQAVRQVHAALPCTAIGGRHGVDVGEHVQPLRGEGREREGRGYEGRKRGSRLLGSAAVAADTTAARPPPQGFKNASHKSF